MSIDRSEVRGSVVLVTGASRNIGRAIALRFAAAGLGVGVNARSSRSETADVVAEIEAAGGRAAAVMGDVADPEACADIVARTEALLGPIDHLVSNASRRRFVRFSDTTPADWDATIASNLSAAFYLSRLVLPGMKERGFGRVIVLGGPDGYLGWHHRAANVTAKAGLTGLVKAISFEFGHFGVTANVVVPGGTDTTRSEVDYPKDMLAPEGVPQGSPLVMIPGKGTVGELAETCLFLASEHGRYVTGQSWHVDGGMVMR
jgi:3-oxoacyl-[acyl-carrier protein] reductase